MDNNQFKGQQSNRQQQPVRPQMQGQMQQKPVRPAGNQGQRPIRPQVHGQRQQVQGQNQGQNQGQMQQRPRPQVQQRQPMSEEQNFTDNQQADNNFEDFNSAVVTDTVAENRARGKKVKAVKEKKVVTPEQKKKRLVIGGIVAGILVVIAVLILVLNTITKKNSQHINIANTELSQQVNEPNTPDNETPVVDNTEEEVNDTETNTETPVEETKPTVTDIQAVECSEDNPLDINEYSFIDLMINTKTAEDSSYVDREAQAYVRMSNVVSGYNEVSEYIKQYNNTNTQNKNINLPDANSYYTQSSGTEMVMVEFELLYPTDFPTSASEGIVYRIPVATLNVFGTVTDIDSDTEDIQENPDKYMVVDDVIYAITKVTDISVYELNPDKGIKVGEPVKFRYIISLPTNATSEVYGFSLDLDTDTEDLGKYCKTFWFKGQSIEQSEELKTYLENAQEQENNTEATDESESSEENTETNDNSENNSENLEEQTEE